MQWDYGQSLNCFDEVITYDKVEIAQLIKKYFDEYKDKVIFNDWLSKLDSVVLYSFIREHQFKNIVEIGCGTSTNIMFEALGKNNIPCKVQSHASYETVSLNAKPECVEFEQYVGNLLNTYYDTKLKDQLKDVDLVFIDGDHESYFTTFYCYYLLEHLKPNTIVHVHDVGNPEVLAKGLASGYLEKKYSTICDEAYTLVQYLKLRKNFKVLCHTMDLVENNIDMISFMPDVKYDTYQLYQHAPKRTTPASSLWLQKI